MAFVLLEFVLKDLGLNLHIRQFLPQALCLYPQIFSFLFADPNFLLHHDGSLNGAIILVFEILERGVGVAGLSFKVVVCYFDIAQLVL